MARVDIADLKNLDTIDKLANIFTSQLNYQYEESPISTRNWKEDIANLIIDNDIQLFAKHEDFHIIYCRIDNLLLGIERPIVNQLLKEHPYLLVIFSDKSCQNWHFVNIKYDEEVKNRRLFKRIVIGPYERLHTAAQRINKLEIFDEKFSSLEVQKKHDEAFDVEEVTKEFFNSFVDMFHLLIKEISENNPIYKSKADEQAQILLNRMMFLYFIQKKGWLDNDTNYLYEKFLSFYKNDPEGYSFYSDFLIRLFQVLSNQDLKFKDLGEVPFLNGGLFEVTPFKSKLPFNLKISNAVFKDIFTKLLEHFNFTVREDTPLDIEVAIDPEMLGKVFENLILQSEKDKDIRKTTGSYYTPRVIVHFMCQESLKEYLITESEIERPKIESLFKMNPAEHLTEDEMTSLENSFTIPQARLLKSFIKNAQILDPAVGSGAFLVGMLHEMISITKLLDIREFGKEHIQRINYDYELKRQLIESPLYGVDIQEQAVRICELRLWLSLIVDYEKTEGEDVPPLPNLSYRIRCGDSLIEKLFGYNVQLDQLDRTDKGRQLIDEIREDKEAYFLARDIQEKNRIELSTLAKQCELMELLIKEKQKPFGISQILPILQETVKERKEREALEETKKEYERLLSLAINTQKKVAAMVKGKISIPAEDIHDLKEKLGISFIWKLDFAEVFKEKGGFDVVIANPPYLNIRNITKYLSKDAKEFFESMFFSAKRGYDYYVLFVEKGLSLNKKNGIFCFIMPNKIQTINYAETIREYLLKQTSLCYIVDISNIRIFKKASVYPNILITKMIPFQKNGKISIGVGFKEAEEVTRYDRYFLRNQDDFLKNPQFTFSLTDKVGSDLLEKIKSKSIPLSDLCRLHAGTTGFSASNISRCIVGKSKPNKNEVDFIVTGNIDRYVINLGNVHYMKKLYQRPILIYDRKYITDGKWKLFTSPKIVIGGMTKHIEAAYDSVGYAIGVGVYALTNFRVDYKYLLAILNSKLLTFIFRSMFEAKHLAGGYLAINKGQLTLLPIKVSFNDSIQKKIIEHVDQILSIYKRYHYPLSSEGIKKVQELEHQIDKKVYELYGLTDEEIALIKRSTE